MQLLLKGAKLLSKLAVRLLDFLLMRLDLSLLGVINFSQMREIGWKIL